MVLAQSHFPGSILTHRTSLYEICFQVEQAQAGLESLSLSETTITHLRENFVEIEKYEYVVSYIMNALYFSVACDACR